MNLFSVMFVLPLFFFISLVFFAVAWVMILLNRKMDSGEKLIWMIGTLFLPVVGPTALFYRYIRP